MGIAARRLALAIVLGATALAVVERPAASVPGRAALADSSPRDPLVEVREDGTVDWRNGVITTTAGAAADLRMPSAVVARPGSERRAKAAAQARLTAILAHLASAGSQHFAADEIGRAVRRATVVQVDYQSNGGVMLRMQSNFGDWAAGPASPDSNAGAQAGPTEAAAFSVPQVRLQAAPRLLIAGQPVAVAAARYRPATSLPPGARPIGAHVDPKGRIVVDDPKASLPTIANRSVVIYFQRLVK